jgi:peptide-methionine (S)-S-oxide reductase
MEFATFAAGCFWGIEARFRKLRGVLESEVGYTGGGLEHPGYREVCTGRTGHAEAVRLRFDPQQIAYAELLEAFWAMHDPTQLDRQGPDIGSQYRSAIFVHGEDQGREAEASRAAQQASGRFSSPIVTRIEPAGPFWRAEEYHQRYLEKHGGSCHI